MLVTLAIAGVLFVWAAYGLSGAGVIALLPLRNYVLPAICAVFLGRAIGFPLLRSTFPENSLKFWLVSSGICLVIGLLYLYGIIATWQSL